MGTIGEDISSGNEALRVAFEQHYVRMLGLAVLLTHSRENAEDLVHDTFVSAAVRIRELDDGEVGPYLRRSLVNHWKKSLRRKAVERRFQAAIPHSRLGERDDLDDRDLLWRAIRSLPGRQRACVVLRYYEDLSERDTADVLGCSIGTVKSHTSRAISRLRKEVHDDD